MAPLLAFAVPARAEEPPATGGDLGGVGLIETRNARFRPDGTIEAGAAWRRQRHSWFLTFQALPFLETTFRLTDRLDATRGRGVTNDRAFDLKLRLWQENAWRPALAIGVQDVIGTGLYAGEYLVASKRFWDVDLSLGLGWGRLGTGADVPNPMGEFWSGFRGERTRRVGAGGTPNFGNLFRGERAAVFGGVEWSLPALPSPFGAVEGLRAKLEWSGDALRDERGGYPARTTGLRGRAASRLNLGLQWQPNPYLDAGIHFVHGTDLLLAQNKTWRRRKYIAIELILIARVCRVGITGKLRVCTAGVLLQCGKPFGREVIANGPSQGLRSAARQAPRKGMTRNARFLSQTDRRRISLQYSRTFSSNPRGR